MRKTLPTGEGGPLLYPVLRVDETVHPDTTVLANVETARESGVDGLFIVDAKKGKSTKYIDGVLGLVQKEHPDFRFGISYPQFKGALAAIHQVRWRLLLGQYEEPMLWVEDPLGGTTKEFEQCELLDLIRSPELSSASTPELFGSIAVGSEVTIVPDFLDVAVMGGVKHRKPESQTGVATVAETSGIPVAVSGISNREELYTYVDAHALIITAGIEAPFEAGILNKKMLEGFVATKNKLVAIREQETAGSVA